MAELAAKQLTGHYKDKAKNKIINDKLIIDHIKKRKEGGFSKIYSTIQTRIHKIFKKWNIPFTLSYDEILNCSPDKLEHHLVSQFTPGMTIDNHGEWEVDHIIPIASFNFRDKENVTNINIIKCFGYHNLQPL